MTPLPRYAPHGDVRVAYETFGDLATGQPLLLVMGLDFQMVWWPEAFCEQLVEAGFAVVRFDNRDTGLSTHVHSPAARSPWRALLGKTAPAYTGTDMLGDATAVLDAVGWTSAHVMGASMGAGLAQALALQHPHRVRSLVSVMGLPVTAGVLRTLTYVKLGVFAKLRGLRPASDRDEEIRNLTRILRVISSPGFPFPEQWAHETAGISYDRAPRDPRTTQRQLAAGRTLDLPALTEITVPTLVISGGHDPLLRVSGGRDTARAIPGATFVSYAGMGHNLPEELWPSIIGHIKATTG